MKKGGGDGGAGAARAEEQARQQRIREGTQKINNIFDGYETVKGVGAVDRNALAAGTTYFTGDGKEFRYTPPTAPPANTMQNAGVYNPSYEADARNAQSNYDRYMASVPGELFTGVEKSRVGGQFEDGFFENRKKSYLDYALPQLNDQYSKARQELIFSLDRSGTLDSSARAEKEADLEKLYKQRRQQVADQGLSYSTQARGNVEDARANLVQMLNATGDVEGAVNSAMTRAKALSAPDTYSPLGQMFADFTGTLGQQAALEKAIATNSYGGGGGVQLYGTNKKNNSVKVS